RDDCTLIDARENFDRRAVVSPDRDFVIVGDVMIIDDYYLSSGGVDEQRVRGDNDRRLHSSSGEANLNEASAEQRVIRVCDVDFDKQGTRCWIKCVRGAGHSPRVGATLLLGQR